jgi:hypothetical protein
MLLESINSNGQQINQYQQNILPPLIQILRKKTKDHDICQWKSGYWLETGTQMC